MAGWSKKNRGNRCWRNYLGGSPWSNKRAVSIPDTWEEIPYWLWKRRC